MIRVLVVEDEPVAAAAHCEYVSRVEGFAVAAVAGTAAEAVRALTAGGIDLVLLDMNLPDRHGLDVVRSMRAAGSRVDVIAVTSARDLELVRAAVSQGIVQYVLKPFGFAALRERLERYADYRERLAAGPSASSQDEVDRALGALRGAGSNALPKGLSQSTLDAVAAALRSGGAMSAGEVAELTGTSRVTARRYLEHLADAGVAQRTSRYGGAGRPEVEYALDS